MPNNPQGVARPRAERRAGLREQQEGAGQTHPCRKFIRLRSVPDVHGNAIGLSAVEREFRIQIDESVSGNRGSPLKSSPKSARGEQREQEPRRCDGSVQDGPENMEGCFAHSVRSQCRAKRSTSSPTLSATKPRVAPQRYPGSRFTLRGATLKELWLPSRWRDP